MGGEGLESWWSESEGDGWVSLMGSEVDTFPKFFIKTSNAAEFNESDIQNIEASRKDDPII